MILFRLKCVALVATLFFSFVVDGRAITINFAGSPTGTTRFRLNDQMTDISIPVGSNDPGGVGDIVLGAFSGAGATGAFTQFLPIDDSSSIGVALIAPAQIIGRMDDDADANVPPTNAGLAGDKVYLVVSTMGQSAIFSSSSATFGDAWAFPAFAGDLTDDINLDPRDINEVFNPPGFVGAAITAGSGPSAGLVIYSLGVPVPEPSSGLLGLMAGALWLRRRRRPG